MDFSKRLNPRTVGILLYLSAILGIALMDVFAKLVSGELPIQQILLFRASIALLPVLGFAYFSEPKNPLLTLKTKMFSLQLARGVSGGATFVFFVLALNHAELAAVTIVYLIAPMLILTSGYIFLKEAISVPVIILTTIAFLSSLFMTGFTSDVSWLGSMFAVLSALCHCFATIIGKALSSHDRPATTALYTNLTVLCIAIFWTTVSGLDNVKSTVFIHCVLLGIFGGISYILFACAFKYTEITRLTFLEYTAYVWALILGFFIFSEIPDLYQVLGSLVILGSGVFVLILAQRQS